jgi:hypothetical protein
MKDFNLELNMYHLNKTILYDKKHNGRLHIPFSRCLIIHEKIPSSPRFSP